MARNTDLHLYGTLSTYFVDYEREDGQILVARIGETKRSHFRKYSRDSSTLVRTASLSSSCRLIRMTDVESPLSRDGILDEIFEDIRENVACLYRCSEAVALLDMLARQAISWAVLVPGMKLTRSVVQLRRHLLSARIRSEPLLSSHRSKKLKKLIFGYCLRSPSRIDWNLGDQVR